MENLYIESVCLGLQLATVNSLRLSENGNWDLDLLNDLFTERDIQLILSIPLSRHMCDDCWMWGDDKRGVYTVKSGYKALMNAREQITNTSSTNWQLIWKMKIPAKVRNFLWRTLSNCLPTKKMLQGRRVAVAEWCPLCHHEPEDTIHALVFCPYSGCVWSLTSIGSHVGTTNTFVEWWNNIVLLRDSSDIEVAATILWSIWQNRNDLVWNGKSKSAAMIFYYALDLRTQWLEANHGAAQRHLLHRTSALPKWNVPPENFLKCNVDAALFNNSPHMGYGCLIRNAQCMVLAAIYGSLPGTHNPTIAEALGIREALSWIKDHNFSNIILESDALIVIHALKEHKSDITSLGLIVNDCRILASDLQSCNFAFVRRSANQVAHALARAADSLTGSEGWVSPSPSLISTVILPDVVE